MDKFLIHGFANIKTPVELNLSSFQDFIWTFGGGQNRFRKAGVNGNLFSIVIDKRRYYVFFSKFERDNFLAELHTYMENMGIIRNGYIIRKTTKEKDVKILPLLSTLDIIIPGDKNFCRVCEKINLHISEIRNVLDECISGNLPYQFINKCFLRTKELDCFSICWNKWDSRICLNQEIIDGIDLDMNDFIDLAGVLQPTISKSDTRLEYTKKCLNCGTYYQEKGAKAVFCSEACRSSFRRRKDKKARAPTV